MSDGLYVALSNGDLKLELLAEHHREPLRKACAADPEIWEIYPFSYLAEHFDPQFDLMLGQIGKRSYAVTLAGEVVGMTAWIDVGQPGWAIEIGNTYFLPRLRGTDLNRRVKNLMIDHAFACGLERVAFKVDAVNARSRAAVLKLGCRQEGILRRERKTWTGRVRDAVQFSLLRDEWSKEGR